MERGKLFAQSRVFSLPPCFPLCRLPEAEGFLPGRAIQSEGTQFRKGVSPPSEGVCKKRHSEDGAGCGGPEDRGELMTDVWKSFWPQGLCLAPWG